MGIYRKRGWNRGVRAGSTAGMGACGAGDEKDSRKTEDDGVLQGEGGF